MEPSDASDVIERLMGDLMTDKTREDFERWAKQNNRCTNRREKNIRENVSPSYYSPLTELAWQAHQKGIADARKPSTETKATCINCGLPLTKNPHPQAGTPEMLNVVGYVFGCLPCAEKRANGRSWVLTHFRIWLQRIIDDENSPAPCLQEVLDKLNALDEDRRKAFHDQSAVKPSTETAAEWIARHESRYIFERYGEFDVEELRFLTSPGNSWASLISSSYRSEVCINLETADDCEMLCKILRVVPVERVVGT